MTLVARFTGLPAPAHGNVREQPTDRRQLFLDVDEKVDRSSVASGDEEIGCRSLMAFVASGQAQRGGGRGDAPIVGPGNLVTGVWGADPTAVDSRDWGFVSWSSRQRLPRGFTDMGVRTFAVLRVVVGCLLASLASAQTAVVDDVALRRGGAADGEWLTVGLDLAETRYSPFTATIDGGSNYAVNPDFTYQPGKHNEGLARATIATRPKPPAIGPPVLDGQRTVLFAWDPVSQTERWRAPVGGARFGGTLTTADNLVFQVAPDGRLLAYNAENGKKLLEIQLATKTGMGPPITYLIDGKQYVALMGGTGQVAASTPTGRGTTPATGSITAGPSPKLFTFVLDGNGRQPE